MAIRDSFRRALRRSGSSSSSSQTDPSMGTTTIISSTTASSETSLSSSSHKSSRFGRTWTWGSNKDKISRSKEKKSQSSRTRKQPTHPSERPLTTQNLRHQELLSQFTWTFGATDPNQIVEEDSEGISPCCTRAPSIDLGDTTDSGST